MQIHSEHIADFKYEHSEKGEDFKMLAYISTLFFDKTFHVFGTNPEKTTLALSQNSTNQVISYSSTPFQSTKENIKQPIVAENMMETFKEKRTELLQSTLIYIDIEPHGGKDEYRLYNLLKEWGYTGIIIFDDIWHFKAMRDHLWYKIPEALKYDLTDMGHWSGSGLVCFQPSLIRSISPTKPILDHWTLVTAYFNLTKCPDASREIHKRDKAYYFEHSVSTLYLPYHLIIYCDEESFSQIVQIRPSEYAHKTQYVVLPFDSFVLDGKTFAQHREKIASNRVSHPYEFDQRNTPSYYLFCMARYIMLKQVLRKNPFQSTHFGWINFCMERMGITNIRRLPEALSLSRDKFSTCYIDYIPESFVRNTREYFKKGHCSMCSGFFTGNGQYMFEVCDLIEKKFIHYLEQGFGHADETLYPSVYFDHPDLFEHYYGDYQEMITNYAYIYENPESPLRNFIANSYRFGDYERCFKACNQLLKSLKKGKCTLNQEQFEKLCFYFTMSAETR
jgi:hypothetical protein